MFNKISYTWSLMGASWDVLRKDKTLLLFPFLSGLCCLAVLGTFAIPIWLADAWRPPSGDAQQAQQVAYYGILFLFYLANYFVITFFNTAIVSCALLRLAGGEPTLGDGFKEAASRLPQIAGWALLSATVGLILRIIEDRSEKVGRIVAGLLGMAWTVLSYMVVPVIVVERKGPFAALKSSSTLLKKTWGDQLVGNFSFGMMFALMLIPAAGLVFVGLLSGSGIAFVLCLSIAVMYLLALSLVQSALQSIFLAAVYLYARNGTSPIGFDGQTLAGALQAK